MNKFWTYFRTDLKTTWQQWPMLIGVFVLLPFVLMLFMGSVNFAGQTDEIEFEPILISLENNDAGMYGAELEKILLSEQMETFFELADANEQATFDIVIEEDYSEDLQANAITVYSAPDAYTSDTENLQSILESIQQSIYEQAELGNFLAENTNEEAAAEITDALLSMATLSEEFSVNTIEAENDTMINTLQVSATSGVFYLLLMLAAQDSSMRTDERFNGLVKRLNIIPLNAAQNISFSLASNIFTMLILSIIYIGVWKIVDFDMFRGNLLFYIIAIFAMTYFLASVFKLLNTLFSGKVVLFIYMMLLFGYIFLGFMPPSDSANPISQLMNNNWMRRVFQDPLNHYATYESTNAVDLSIIFGLIALSLVITLITIFIKHRKEYKAR